MSGGAKDIWKIQDFGFGKILIQIKHFGQLKLSEFPFLHSKKKGGESEAAYAQKAVVEINLAVLMETPGTQKVFHKYSFIPLPSRAQSMMP